MDKKKLKLSISGNAKKTITSIENAKNSSRNTVVINKNKTFQKKKFYKSTSTLDNPKRTNPNLGIKKPTNNFFQKKDISDFEKRKLAEHRATKRLKGEISKEVKEKSINKRRELKLTVSRALSDDDGGE